MKRLIGLFAVLSLCLPMVGEGQSIEYKSSGVATSINAPLLVDEFISGINTNGHIGSLGWGFQTNSSQLAAEGNRPGIYRFSNGAATTAGVGLQSGTDAIVFSNVNSVLFVARWGTGANVPDKRAGVAANGLLNPPNQGARFECLAADTNWFAVTKSAGAAETRTDTGVAFVANTWYRLRIEHPSASTWRFFIDDVFVGTNTSNVPTESAAGQPFFSISGTGAASTMDVDYFEMKLLVTR